MKDKTSISSFHRLLQFLKTGTTFRIYCHDFTIEDGSTGRKLLDCFSEVRKLVSPVFFITTPEANSAGIQMAKHSITIKLQLMQPFITCRWFVFECGKLRRNELGHRSFARARNFLNLFLIHRSSVAGEGTRCSGLN